MVKKNLAAAGLSAAIGIDVVIEDSDSRDGIFLDLVSAVKSTYVWDQKIDAVAITVKSWLGETCYLGINLNDTVRHLKEKIRDREGLPIDEVRLTHGGLHMKDHTTLNAYKITNNNILDLTHCPTGAMDDDVKLRMGKLRHGNVSDDDKALKAYNIDEYDIIKVICIRSVNGETYHIEIGEHDKVRQLKEKIRDKEGIPVEEQNLIYNGIHLEDDHELQEYSIAYNDVVYVVLRLRGGMGGENPVALKISAKEFDSEYDYVYPKSESVGEHFIRGARNFERPYGWSKYALKVEGKYENDNWLGCGGSRSTEQDDVPGEWPVSYHGSDIENANPIVQDGFLLSKGKRAVYGPGIYSSPTPSIAESYATQFNFEGSDYKMVFMNRVNVNSNDTNEVQVPNIGTYFITTVEKSIRPYALLFKKLN